MLLSVGMILLVVQLSCRVYAFIDKTNVGYVGCYQDQGAKDNQFDLNGKAHKISWDMTIEKCIALCAGITSENKVKFQFAGLSSW